MPKRPGRGWRRWRWPLAGLAIIIIAAVVWQLWPSSNNPSADQNPVVKSYQQKLPSLKAAAQEHPGNVSDRTAYAEALYVTGDKTAAEAQYLAAAKLSPSDATIQNNLGNTYRDLGDTSAAVAAYKKAITLAPTSQNAYVNLANLQIYTLHQPADGIATYKEALKNTGATAQFELLLGLAYEQNHQTDKAKQAYQTILAKDPHNQAAKDNLARLKNS